MIVCDTPFTRTSQDSGGEIEKDELAEALFKIGYRIPKDRFDELFMRFDEDGGGTIDFQEFTSFIQRTNMRPRRSVKFAMDLFRRYDEDKGGTIDKFEFAELAAEVEANYKRRTFLAGAAASLGALGVAKYSEEFAWAQKTFRTLYIEKKAEEAQQK
jgi:Ca2+-binding EF-hand superfamily protein